MNRAERLGVIARTVPRIGGLSLLRAARYRIGLRRGAYALAPAERNAEGPFFASPAENPGGEGAGAGSPVDLHAFGHVERRFDSPPDWFRGLIDTRPVPGADLPWIEALAAFPPDRDIKDVWEPSRFYWVPTLAEAARAGDPGALVTLDRWLADWSGANPAYFGINWSCGQEAGLRVLMLARAATILDRVEDAGPGVLDLLRLHARRIAATLHYAIAQDNNHGSSEAAALFVAGSWLARSGGADAREAEGWRDMGRRWLEDRARVLILEDGGPCQYSATYHRVVLDTYSFAETWRRRFALAPFSAALGARVADGARWLRRITDPRTGDAPNMGANDGTRSLFHLSGPWRDFRPSIDLAMQLFGDADPADPTPSGRSFDATGLHVVRRGEALACLRYPRFAFRPSQADALHCDLWVAGWNLLPDDGTYSYALAPPGGQVYGTTATHNTIEFDGRNQMPKIGRFLFGDWLRATDVRMVTEDGRAAAGYRDRNGASHHRSMTLGAGELRVEDEIGGTFERAVLRWRLAPGEWEREGETVRNGAVTLSVSADQPILEAKLVRGFRALDYLKETPVPVFEVTLARPGSVVTRVVFGDGIPV